jgi:hypothetical protein
MILGTFLLIGVFILILFLLKRRYFSNINKSNQERTQPEFKSKNKWLYSSDNFGKMEEGVVRKDRKL